MSNHPILLGRFNEEMTNYAGVMDLLAEAARAAKPDDTTIEIPGVIGFYQDSSGRSFRILDSSSTWPQRWRP